MGAAFTSEGAMLYAHVASTPAQSRRDRVPYRVGLREAVQQQQRRLVGDRGIEPNIDGDTVGAPALATKLGGEALGRGSCHCVASPFAENLFEDGAELEQCLPAIANEGRAVHRRACSGL